MIPNIVQIPEPGPDAHVLFEECGYGRTVTVRLDSAGNTLGDLAAAFEVFLRGCGYALERMEIITDREDSP